MMFPSRSRRFIRVTAKQAYESLVPFIESDLGAVKTQSEGDESSFIGARVGGAFGVAVNVRISAEDGTCALELGFRYGRSQFMVFIILVAAFGLSLFYGTLIPLAGIVLILPIAYKANSSAQRFLAGVNEFLPHLEAEYARLALEEERRRWQEQPKDTTALYRRLCDKHVKVWGDTHALEYKLKEYENRGLTREEAIRKTADEEGIF